MTIIRRLISLLLLTTALAGGLERLHAQTLQASLSHFSTDDGMKSNAIAKIVQDDYGYIWLATWNGISRFDGFHFYNYQTGNGSHIPNLHNRILDLSIDYSQNIWMRMYDGRVFVIDRLRDRIVNPFENVSNSEEYRASFPLFASSAGDIYIPVKGVGLYKMRKTGDKVDAQLITTIDLNVTCIAEGYHNDIWLGTDKGVHRVDISNLSVERKAIFEDEVVNCLFSDGFNIYVGTKSGRIRLFAYGQEPKTLREGNGKEILSIYVDSHGLIWFSDPSMGTFKYDRETGAEKHFQQTVLVPEYDGVGSDVGEAIGTVWMRMNHGGFGYYNRETDEVEYFHNDPVNPWNLSNHVNAWLALDEGVVFESTGRHGLERLEVLRNNITRTLLVPNPTSPLENEIRAIYYDSQRKLMLIGNKNNTLYLIRSDSTRTAVSTDSNGNPIGRIYGISKDSKGNYWLSSKDHGLFKMSPNATGGYTIVNYCHDDNDKWSINSNSVYATVEDKHGNIWVATYGGGVNVLTKDKNGHDVFKHRDNVMRNYPYNSYYKVRTLTTDNEGNVWAGTTDGILLFKIKGGDVVIKKLEESKEYPEQILMSNDIIYLARDHQGAMWVGTNGGGMGHSIGRDSKGCWLFETLGSQDGLPSEEIKSITFDAEDNVWFATDHVLCYYNVQKKIFTSFSSLEGVDQTICSEGAAVTLPDGIIIFGTVNGYYTVDRKKLITDNGAMIKLRITDFFLDDELMSPRLNHTFDYYVPDAKRVELHGHNHTFGFRFASLNYQLQHRVHYQYMLEGYDMEWQNASKDRMASYSGVPTGVYHFKVKAFLLDSPDKYDMRVIEVVVPPFFLFSNGAVWIWMILFAALALLLMFWRQARIAQNERIRLMQMGADEMKFANNEDYLFVRKQMDWLEEHYSDAELKIDDLVTHSGLSRVDYLDRLKALVDQSPKEFVNDFRLKKAIQLLQQTNDNVSEIAAKTGFSDPVSFTRLFKSKMGVPPSRFREDARRDAAPQADTAVAEQAPQAEEPDVSDDYELIE